MVPRVHTTSMKAFRQVAFTSQASARNLAPTRHAGCCFLHVSSRSQLSSKTTTTNVPLLLRSPAHLSNPQQSRSYASTPSTPTADALMENLTDLYSTARDEFEIAAEETEKKTTYGEEDREAAHEAFNVLKEAYQKAVSESGDAVRKEVERRVGPRIRELESALQNMDEMALED